MKKILLIFFLLILSLYLEYNRSISLFEKKDECFFDQNKCFTSTIDFKIKKGFLFKNYKGKMAYKKNSCLDLKIKSNQEFLNIGFNEDYFWYVGSDDPTFYYGHSKDAHFLLKEIFNPKNLLDIVLPKNENTAIGNYGKILKKVIKIENEKINFVSLYDDLKLVYSIEYKKYTGNIPTDIEVYYVDDKILVKILINELKQVNNYDFSLPIKEYKKTEKLSP